jgi:hypothetical protein
MKKTANLLLKTKSHQDKTRLELKKLVLSDTNNTQTSKHKIAKLTISLVKEQYLTPCFVIISN